MIVICVLAIRAAGGVSTFRMYIELADATPAEAARGMALLTKLVRQR